MPTHPLLIGLDLGQRATRHGGQGDVVMLQMGQGAVQMIGQERTARTAGGPVGAQHEMIDDQLAAAGEQIGQGLFAGRRIEDVIGRDLDPGQGQALRIQLIAQISCFLLFGEQRSPCRQPFFPRYDRMGLHAGSSCVLWHRFLD
jgi:hypothetical protein